MDCFCGCGTKLPRDRTGLNIRVGELALELLAWDKYRTISERDPVDAIETERLIDRGAACFGRQLSTLHGERDIRSLRESDEWLAESRARWARRSEMTERGSFLRGPKLRLTDEDFARLDRVHPDRSFSATTGRADGVDLAAQLERLGALRAEGVLTEGEFRAAKARVLGTVGAPPPG
jgi:hypothetical protein